MNSFGLARLILSFYRKKLPDLNKIQSKGLLAVKIAQHYALRIDFLDEKMCRHLSKLYTHSFPTLEYKLSELVDKEYLNSNFSSWSETPFASASVGQVHYGYLKDNTKVAIKVLKQEFEEDFLKDVKNIQSLLSKISLVWFKLKKIFNPIQILNTIQEYTHRELNLTNEIDDSNELQSYIDRYSKSFDISNLKLPKIYNELSSEKILVSEYIEGVTFDKLLEGGKLNYSSLLELFRLHSFFIFKVGTFHGDLHPGNVILGEDSNIYLIDCAGLSHISSTLQKELFYFFYHLSRSNFEKSACHLYKMSYSNLSDSELLNFKNEFLELYKDFSGSTVSKVSLTKKMMDTIKLGINHGMIFGDDIFPVIKSLMYLDGMVLKCNPEAVLMDDIKAHTDYLKDYI